MERNAKPTIRVNVVYAESDEGRHLVGGPLPFAAFTEAVDIQDHLVCMVV